jgi:hypothetical protein
MTNRIQPGYGVSHHLFVARKSSNESLVIGGIGDQQNRWTRVLSHRAAQNLWTDLTAILHPDHAQSATGALHTAPLRSADLPTITSHASAQSTEGNRIQVTGSVGNQQWSMLCEKSEAEEFWRSLQQALSPTGWKAEDTGSDQR